jgi:hypothetical protein
MLHTTRFKYQGLEDWVGLEKRTRPVLMRLRFLSAPVREGSCNEKFDGHDCVDEVKSQWKRRARYEKLFVEKATVLFTTRNFKVLTLHEILVLHKVENAERLVPTDPHLGGWGKFIRANITNGSSCKRSRRGEVVLETERRPSI